MWSRRLRTASLPSPTVADGRLYVAESDKNRLLALDAANGDTLWEYRLSDWVIAPPGRHRRQGDRHRQRRQGARNQRRDGPATHDL